MSPRRDWSPAFYEDLAAFNHGIAKSRAQYRTYPTATGYLAATPRHCPCGKRIHGESDHCRTCNRKATP